MSSWACSRCRTVYAVGVPACPQCGSTDYSDGEGGLVAKASAQGATHYLAQGDPVPDDLPEGVRLVGPGAPVAEPQEEAGQAPETADTGERVHPGTGVPMEGTEHPADGAPPDPVGGRVSAADEQDGPADYGAYRLADLRDLARERNITMKASAAKADLADALAQWDASHRGGDEPDAARPGGRTPDANPYGG